MIISHNALFGLFAKSYWCFVCMLWFLTVILWVLFFYVYVCFLCFFFPFFCSFFFLPAYFLKRERERCRGDEWVGSRQDLVDEGGEAMIRICCMKHFQLKSFPASPILPLGLIFSFSHLP